MHQYAARGHESPLLDGPLHRHGIAEDAKLARAETFSAARLSAKEIREIGAIGI